MIVECINDTWKSAFGTTPKDPPIIGKRYEVLKIESPGLLSKYNEVMTFYVLKELPGDAWDVKHFKIITSGDDEYDETMLEELNKNILENTDYDIE